MSTNISLPAGYTLSTKADGDLVLRGTFEDKLHASIKRMGGWWERQEKGWVIPAHLLPKLERLFARRGGELAANATAVAAERDRSEAERWLGYVEEAASEGRIYQKGLDTLAGLRLSRWPELAARLVAAGQQAERVRAEQEAKRREAADRRVERVGQWLDTEKEREQRRNYNRAHREFFPDGYHWHPTANAPTLLNGRVVVYTGAGKSFRIDESGPSVLGSRALGHEGGWGCYWYWREATPDEVAAYEQERAAREDRKATEESRKQRLAQAEARIKGHDDRPEMAGGVWPQGERHHDTLTVYGGGEVFIVNEFECWYIQGNGADGDSFGANNLRGAIGWRSPRTPELVALITE